MRRIALAAIILLTGCIHHPPRTDHLPARRWVIGVPEAGAAVARGTVYLQHAAKQAEDGNVYSIEFAAITNTTLVDPESPYYADIATNRWPSKRSHIDLSLDGGQTYVRRIGYGVPTDPARVGGEFVWSPPVDWSLLTTNAVLRMTDLDGNPPPSRTPAMPYDLPPGHYAQCAPFVIAGIQVLTPTNGAIVWASTPATVRWRQAGAGDTVRVYYITPETVGGWATQCLATVTGCVEVPGTNTASVTMPAPHPLARLILIGTNDVNLHGYSGDISIE
jgi:hypothetical protein